MFRILNACCRGHDCNLTGSLTFARHWLMRIFSIVSELNFEKWFFKKDGGAGWWMHLELCVSILEEHHNPEVLENIQFNPHF